MSDIRRIGLRARLKTNLWHIFGQFCFDILSALGIYIYWGDAYTLDVALQYLKVTVFGNVMSFRPVEIYRRF